jgi:hypothetical protein
MSSPLAVFLPGELLTRKSVPETTLRGRAVDTLYPPARSWITQGPGNANRAAAEAATLWEDL